MKKKGLLLVNLGTPDELSKKAVRRYLREFLSDPYVIDTSALLRFFLLNVIILPFRPKKTLAAYQKIWMSAGSPLRIYSEGLARKLQLALQDDYQVELAMRYGQPGIKAAAAKFSRDGIDKIIVLPLFPQYALATTETALQKIYREFSAAGWPKSDLLVIKNFYNSRFYIEALAKSIVQALQDQPIDHLLLSYHGLPKRQVAKVDKKATPDCDAGMPCPAIDSWNKDCYRAQCFATSNALIKQLDIPALQVTTSFQSRLGRIPWIEPYTDEVIKSLRDKGVKHLACACPSFVVDCLETLEEIGMALKAAWLESGGESFTLIPCLNDNDIWVQSLAQFFQYAPK